MLDVSADGLLVTDAEGDFVECNARCLNIWQLPADWKQRTNKELWSIISSRLVPSESPIVSLKEAIAALPVDRSQTLQLAGRREVECYVQAHRLDESRIGRMWRFRDLTDFRRATMELTQEREWFRVTLSSIGDAVITTDIEARVTFLNPVAEKMTGWTAAEARGLPLSKVFHIINELTRAEAKSPVGRVLAEGIIIGLANHTALIARGGRETAIEDSAAPIRDAAGVVVGAVMVFHDVDARRKAERAVERNEKLLADFFANAPVGLNWLSAKGRILRVNRAELELLGCAESDYVGRPWAEFHVEPGLVADLLRTLTAGGTVENRAARLRTRNGSIREVLISASVFWEDRYFGHARCFTRDVTEQNRAEAARSHLAALVTSSEDAIISKTLDGVIQSWNEGARRLFGYTADEAVGQSIALLIPPDRMEEEPVIVERLKRGERVNHYETVRRRKDGTLVDVSLTVSPIRDTHGAIVGASKIARDISDRKQAERASLEEHIITEQLNVVAQALTTELDLRRIVQVITDAGTRITRAQFGAFFYNGVEQGGESDLLYALSGMERAALETLPMPRAIDLFGPTIHGDGVIRLDDARQDSRFERSAPFRSMPAGYMPVISYLAVPVLGRDGKILGGLFFGHSNPGMFTERDEKIIVAVAAQAAAAMNAARLYAAEQNARATAEAANQAKDHFIATLSHELRTPLTPVLAILSSLREDPGLSPSHAADLEIARRNVLLEARLIDDLLDLTRISRGKLNLQEEVVFIEGVIDAAVNTCRPDLEPRALELVRDLRAPSATIFGDSARLTQVLWNLLKNAIKFTPGGGTITIRSRVQQRENAGEVVIEIQDTGVGIEAEMLPRIFSAFDQGSQETARRFGGLGLGLAISKAIIDAHHGKLVVESPGRDQGSTFTLTLPLAMREPQRESPPASGKVTRAAAPPTRASRILLVEDHVDTARTLKRIFGSWGHTVFTAGTVTEALRVAETEMQAQGLDLVISDLGLPDGSGLELMESLSRKYALTGIALSGFGMESDLKRSGAAGFARHLTKPVDLSLIRAAIAELASGSPHRK
jgi:PAS domain S-box-containing protein